MWRVVRKTARGRDQATPFSAISGVAIAVFLGFVVVCAAAWGIYAAFGGSK